MSASGEDRDGVALHLELFGLVFLPVVLVTVLHGTGEGVYLVQFELLLRSFSSFRWNLRHWGWKRLLWIERRRGSLEANCTWPSSPRSVLCNLTVGRAEPQNEYKRSACQSLCDFFAPEGSLALGGVDVRHTWLVPPFFHAHPLITGFIPGLMNTRCYFYITERWFSSFHGAHRETAELPAWWDSFQGDLHVWKLTHLVHLEWPFHH